MLFIIVVDITVYRVGRVAGYHCLVGHIAVVSRVPVNIPAQYCGGEGEGGDTQGCYGVPYVVLRVKPENLGTHTW